MLSAAAPPVVAAGAGLPGSDDKYCTASDAQSSVAAAPAQPCADGVKADGVSDVTEWRRESSTEDEDSELDTRVECAIMALNDAISANNHVEVEYAEAARQLDELMRTANNELEALQQRHWRWLNEIASFEETKREAKLAAQQLSRISRDLAAAREKECCSNEALEILEDQGPESGADGSGAAGDEEVAARETVLTRLRAQRESARLAVSRLSAEQKQLSTAVKRLTERVIQKSRRVGDAFEGAMPFLARKQSLIERQHERHLELRVQLEETQRAKARVRAAMSALERISLDIQERQTPPAKCHPAGIDPAVGASLSGRAGAETANERDAGEVAGRLSAEDGASTGTTIGPGAGVGMEGAAQAADNTSEPAAVAEPTDHTTATVDDGSVFQLSPDVGTSDDVSSGSAPSPAPTSAAHPVANPPQLKCKSSAGLRAYLSL